MILNLNTLGEVVAAAEAATVHHPRWQHAIARAAREIVDLAHMDYRDGALLLSSSSSGKMYETTETSCQCQAFAFRQPCWHRAAARLLRRYRERIDRTASPRRGATLPADVLIQPPGEGQEFEGWAI